MRCLATLAIVVIAVLAASSASHAQLGLRVGGGIHYVRTVGDIEGDPEFDANAFNLLASVQAGRGLFKIEGDVEWVPDFGGSGESLWQPQAYILAGGLLYGGAGIGWGYFDGDWFDQPFYALRAGVDFPLGPISLDINANYRFQNTKVLDSIDEEDVDTLTFGAVARFDL